MNDCKINKKTTDLMWRFCRALYSKNEKKIKGKDSQGLMFYKGILLKGKRLKIYHELLNSLIYENALNHLDKKDIEERVKVFVENVCNILESYPPTDGNEKFPTDIIKLEIQNLVDSFSSKKLLYKLIVPITGIGELKAPIKFANVEYRRFNGIDFEKWNEQVLQSIKSRFGGKIVAIYNGEVSSVWELLQRGLGQIEAANGALASIHVRSPQSVVEIDRGLIFYMSKEKEGTTGFKRDTRTLFRSSFDAEHLKQIQNIDNVLMSTGRNKLKNRLTQSLVRVARAESSPMFDEKIVQICMALEALFKFEINLTHIGEVMAERNALLNIRTSGVFHNPSETLYIFFLRNEIVHGTPVIDIPRHRQDVISSKVESELWSLKESIRNYAKAIIDNDLKSETHMRDWLEQKDDKLKDFAAWMDDYINQEYSHRFRRRLGILNQKLPQATG